MKKCFIVFCFLIWIFPLLAYGFNSHDEELNESKKLEKTANQLYTAGRYIEAESLLKRSLVIREKILGPDNSDTAQSLNNLALLYWHTGRYTEAESLYKRSLAIVEKVLGSNHPYVSVSLNNIALLYSTTGRYSEAEFLYKRSLAISEKIFGHEHPNVAGSLNSLGALYVITGRYAEAEPLYKRSLTIREKALGPDHLDVALSLGNLAGFYYTTGRYAEAEPLYKRSLTIREKALGPDHPDVTVSLNNLASLYDETGRYAEAEPLYKRSLTIREKALGPDHPDVSVSLNNIAVLYSKTSRYSEAEPLYKRSLAISEKIFGHEHPNVAQFLNNLAELYIKTSRYAEAEPLYKRSLTIREKALGPDHPDVATSLNNMSVLYWAAKRLDEAEPLCKRSLAIREKALGLDHPDVATSLNNLASLCETAGRYVEAESLYKRALEIKEKILGPDHPDVAVSLSNLGFLFGTTGIHPEAHTLFRRSISIQDTVRESTFTLLTEKHKLFFMKTQQGYIYGYLSHTLNFPDNDQTAVTDTFNAWLKWKGSILEAQGRYLDAVTTADDPKLQGKLKTLTEVRRELAGFQLSGPRKMTSQDYRWKIAELQKKREYLESELMVMSRDFLLQKKAQTADVKTLSAILSRDAAYLDYAKITIYDFNKMTWANPHYLLFLFTPGEAIQVRLMYMGTSDDVDRHIYAYLREMGRVKYERLLPDERKLKQEASTLYNILIRPVEPFLKEKKHVFISPDGNLNLIPFEALVTPSGTYLMEGYLISYVGAGRDMVKFTPPSMRGGASLIIADPDYDLGQKDLEQARNAAGVMTTHIRGPVSRDAMSMRFDRLPDTKEEANAIEKILRIKFGQKVANFQNTKALEDILFNTSSPKILHLATHGFFLSEEETKQPKKMQGFLLSNDSMKIPPITIENPMLRSGIVFAGVNTSLKEGRDEGMVTAEKVLGLNLKGTDLVVLSACETGIGDIQSGEGVFGLKRAFILSGANTIIMSLWSVPSKETVDLMTSFYMLLSEGKSRAEALRQAKLALMKQNPNPFFWGAFVMTGSP